MFFPPFLCILMQCFYDQFISFCLNVPLFFNFLTVFFIDVGLLALYDPTSLFLPEAGYDLSSCCGGSVFLARRLGVTDILLSCHNDVADTSYAGGNPFPALNY